MYRGRDEKRSRWHGVLVAAPGVVASAVVFALYLRTLAPTMLYYDPSGMYDSVMLQAKAYVLGIPNPTGYPTYIMLAHLFTHLPFGDVAYRVNLASAVYAAAAVFILYLVCRKLTGRIAPSVAAAFLFGVSRAFWNQAIIAEVYTLNVLFIALDILLLLVWRERREDRYLLLLAFCMGLTMTHHMTSALLLPAAVLFVAVTERGKLLEWKLLLKGAGLYAVGLIPYLYLPLRASMDPPLNETDPSTLGRFLALVTGSGFESRMFAFGLGDMPERLLVYATYLLNQFHPVFLMVAALGFSYLVHRRDWAILATFSLLYSGWLIYALSYNIRDVFVYFIPTYLIICLFVAVGFGNLMDLLEYLARNASVAPRAAALTLLSAVMLALPLSGVGRAYEQVDRSEDYHGRHIMDEVIRDVAPDSTVMHNGGVMWYMKYVTDHRQDLRVVDPFPSGGWTARSPLWVEKAEKYRKKGRVYIIFPSGTAEENTDLFHAAGYELVADDSGYFHEVVPRRRGEE